MCLLLRIFLVFFICIEFAKPLCASVYMCLVVNCWERTDLFALVCGVLLWVCHFPIGILGQVWYLIVSIPDLCTLTYFDPKSELRVRLVPSNWFKPSSKIFYWHFPGNISFVDHLCYLCCVFVMLRHVYCCCVVTCWERADLLALVCNV